MKNVELAQKYQKNGRMRKAAKYWIAVLADTPDDEHVLSSLLICQRVIGDFANAQQTANKLIQCDNMSDDSVISLAYYYSDIGQPGIAFDYFRSIKNDSNLYLQSLLGSALCNIRTNRLSDAKGYVELAKEVPVQFPEESESWANVYLLLREYRNSAVSWLKTAALADSFNKRVYALSSLLSLPLSAMSVCTETISCRIMALLAVLFFLLLPLPWSLALYILLLPVFTGVILRHILVGRVRNLAGIMVMILSLLAMAFLDIE